MRLFLPAFVLSSLLGCLNPCQQICSDMARYASDDCGIEVSVAEISQCEAEQGTADRETRGVCSQGNSVDDIAATWSCDDVEDFFPES